MRTHPSSYPGGVQDEALPMDFDYLTNTNALTAASAKADVYGQPQPSASEVIKPVQGARQLGIELVCVGTADEWFELNVWHYRAFTWSKARATPPNVGQKFDPVYRPRLLATVKGQAGARAVGSSGLEFLTAGALWADVLTVVADYTYGDTTDVAFEAADGAAALIIDPMGADFIGVELRCAVPAGEAGTPVDSLLAFVYRL